MDRADFSAHLAEYGAMAQQALLDWLPRQEPDRHLYGPMRAFIETSGKGLRPALMIATCRAFGGSAEDVLTSAAALELLHNAFLIHDDIEDESEFRRGLPCVHTAMGVPLAINVGDAMQTMALRLLRRNADHLPPDVVARIFDEFDHLLSESIEGQAMELGWIKDNDAEENLLVQFHSSLPRRRVNCPARQHQSGRLQRFWLLPGCSFPDPRRRAELGGRAGKVWQRNRRRYI
jgi:geranylgeranyl diphosphate synthase, type II